MSVYNLSDVAALNREHRPTIDNLVRLLFVPCVTLVLLLVVAFESAAQIDMEQRLPNDSSVTVGQLENGVRYYIRSNQRPENRAELRLIIDAGSILEDEDQRGLAHFVEHMAFNGTRRFPKQELVEYLERVGMRFGADVNAATNFDFTAYMLTVPTDSAEILHKAFEVMRDWAGDVTFDSTEIEKERGVVLEEWRLGRGAFARVQDRQFPVLFSGSQYADRLPIGKPETLRSFDHAALRRFYSDWYRPDLMAVIAVGDFDPSEIEELIQKNFADLTSPETPRPRAEYDVPEHDETLYAVATDPEITSTDIALYYKGEPEQPGVVGAYRQSLIGRLYRSMLNERLYDIQEQAKPPFLYATTASARFVRPMEVVFLAAGVRGGESVMGLEALLTEAERVARHGFLQTELDRHKARVLRSFERAHAERDKTRSVVFAGEYVRHFLEGEAFPGIEFEFRLTQELLPDIHLSDVNVVAQATMGAKNRVVLLSAPEIDTVAVATSEMLAAVFDRIAARSIGAHQEDIFDGPLITATPAAGDVVAEHYVESIGVTDWALSNGVRVILKPTDFQNDQVLFQATSPGGTSIVEDIDYVAAMTASSIVGQSGVGAFSRVDLDRKLSGKAVSIFPEVNDVGEGMSGGAAVDDLETLFQLIHLYFTAPRLDSAAFLNFQGRMQEFVRNRNASPEVALSDTLTAVLTQSHFRTRPFTTELFDEMNLDKSLAFFQSRFSDASDFTFVFVGNFDVDDIKPWVEMYIGGLPATHRLESWRDVGIRAPRGVIRKVVRRGLEPQSQTRIQFKGDFEGERDERFAFSALGRVLDIRLREELREELGGTYGASVWTLNLQRPRATYTLGINFGSDPERADEMVASVFSEIERLKSEGPAADDVAKVVESLRRGRETALRENSFWRFQLMQRAQSSQPLDLLLTYDELVAGLTTESIQRAAVKYLDTDNYVLVTLLPEELPRP